MKILFKILDYISAVLMGVGTLFLVSLVISNGWNMFFAMIVGMILGTGVLMLAVLLFSFFSTPFEIFPVGMVITMPIGMAAGMAVTVADPDVICMLSVAAVFSLFAQLGIDLYNMKIKGEVRVDKEQQ
jgi:hypothetical protein